MSLSIRTKGSFLVGTRWSSSSSSSKGSSDRNPQSPGLGSQVAPSRSNSNDISPIRASPWPTAAPWGTTSSWDPNDVAIRRFAEPVALVAKPGLSKDISGARAAYAKAFVAIAKATKNRGVDAVALLSSSTEKDVVEAALTLYSGAAATEKTAVSRFVDTLHHYHGVFDVLSQVDFGCLTAIWGGMKLILIVCCCSPCS